MRALQDEKAPYDIAISSAMDLQTKLANDGLALAHSSVATTLLPDWGKWHDYIFAFTQEPATIVISTKAFGDLPLPKTRQDLISILREHPDRFRGRVGTYDVVDVFALMSHCPTCGGWTLEAFLGPSDSVSGLDVHVQT